MDSPIGGDNSEVQGRLEEVLGAVVPKSFQPTIPAHVLSAPEPQRRFMEEAMAKNMTLQFLQVATLQNALPPPIVEEVKACSRSMFASVVGMGMIGVGTFVAVRRSVPRAAALSRLWGLGAFIGGSFVGFQATKDVCLQNFLLASKPARQVFGFYAPQSAFLGSIYSSLAHTTNTPPDTLLAQEQRALQEWHREYHTHRDHARGTRANQPSPREAVPPPSALRPLLPPLHDHDHEGEGEGDVFDRLLGGGDDHHPHHHDHDHERDARHHPSSSSHLSESERRARYMRKEEP